MFMKILMYGNEWNDFKSFIELIPKLEKEGCEVAVATHNKQLIPSLSAGRLLVVTLSSYYDDVTVTIDGSPLPNKKVLSIKELEEML